MLMLPPTYIQVDWLETYAIPCFDKRCNESPCEWVLVPFLEDLICGMFLGILVKIQQIVTNGCTHHGAIPLV
jgi:hypothetical protein